ncbi:hypothetical protein V6N13_133841 [Hibiscus sabdariffa]|uniref:RRM domain-containing protein n=1 Tax=Hibiscus sabdariffa TaxID=183260 RepID=A0ABR2R0A2_9ROSI
MRVNSGAEVGRRVNGRMFNGRNRRLVSSSRKGADVFVNYVSKRVHPRSLREAFEEYVKVLDVYVAYNNRRRLGMRSTFTFVRFSIQQEVEVAVNNANNREMDVFFY